jgi:DNA-binding response OmpR family regulator
MLHPRPEVFTRIIHRRPLLKRGAVTATADPVELRWNGERVPLSPLEATVLVALLRRSRMRWDEVQALLLDHGGCPDSRDVLIHRIRRKFADLGAQDPIETLRGWGIRFRTEPDRQGSSALWIGASEHDEVAG